MALIKAGGSRRSTGIGSGASTSRSAENGSRYNPSCSTPAVHAGPAHTPRAMGGVSPTLSLLLRLSRAGRSATASCVCRERERHMDRGASGTVGAALAKKWIRGSSGAGTSAVSAKPRPPRCGGFRLSWLSDVIRAPSRQVRFSRADFRAANERRVAERRFASRTGRADCDQWRLA